jgi:phage shock protein PspC (stress-responsive transcriptional regulator)
MSTTPSEPEPVPVVGHHATAPGVTAPAAAPEAAGDPAQPQGFSQIRDLHIVRPDEGRWAAGVAAGLARRWNVDPLLVRGGFVALTLLGGLGVLAYGVGWLLLPQADGRIHVEEAGHGKLSPGFFGAALTTLAGMGSAPSWLAGWGYDTGGTPPLLAIVLVGGVIWWAATRPKKPGSTQPGSTQPGSTQPGSTQPAVSYPSGGMASTDPTALEPGVSTVATTDAPYGTLSASAAGPYSSVITAPTWPTAPASPTPAAAAVPAGPPVPARPPGFSLAFVGAALLAGTGVIAWDRWAHPIAAAPVVAAAVALGMLGLGIVTAGVTGRRGGPLTFFAIVLAVVGLGNLSPSGNWTHTSPPTWAPTAATSIGDGYGLGAGDATVDLTSSRLLATATTTNPVTVPVQLGAGKLRVLVPAGVPVRINLDLGMGHVDSRLDGRQLSGNITETVVSGTGDPKLIVDVNVGFGDIELVSQGATS